MESNDKLKEINIKNVTCFYFDDKIKIKDLDFNSSLLNEKSQGIILIYDISHLWHFHCVSSSIK